MTTTTSRAINELTFEIERFYFEEASLLEIGDYKRWLTLLTEDIVYRMPQQEFVDRSVNRELDAIGAHGFDGEDKKWIIDRVGWLLGSPSPEVPMPMRRMFITNILVQEARADSVVVDSKFILWEVRTSGQNTTFVGLRRDVLRRLEEGWQIARREVTLDSAILPRSLTNFF